MKILFKILIALFPFIALAQSNYRTGNINDCYTWGQWAQIYTTLNNVSVTSGTVITVNETNIKMNSISLASSSSAFTFSTAGMGIDFTGTRDIRCGGIYGQDMADGTGKFKYYITTSADCANPATQPNYDITYIYRGYTVTFGPIRRSGTYKWTKFFGILYNLSTSIGTCGSCWTSDWNFYGTYYRNGVEIQSVGSNIWNNRGRLYKTTICSNTYEVYENNFSFNNVILSAGDMIEIRFTTPPTSGGTAIGRGCCVDPLHYIAVDLELTEQ